MLSILLVLRPKSKLLLMNFHIKQKKKKFQIHNCIPCSRTSIVSFKQKIATSKTIKITWINL